jgi:hypothetical protein
MRVRRPDHTGIALTPEVRLVGKASAAGQQPRILAPPNRLADPLRRDLLFHRMRPLLCGGAHGATGGATPKGAICGTLCATLGAVSIVIGS